jgi:hypothetical protein
MVHKEDAATEVAFTKHIRDNAAASIKQLNTLQAFVLIKFITRESLKNCHSHRANLINSISFREITAPEY